MSADALVPAVGSIREDVKFSVGGDPSFEETKDRDGMVEELVRKL